MKNQKIRLFALACGVLSLAFTASAHAQTISNGDFGTGDTTGYTTTGAVGVDGPGTSTGQAEDFFGPTYPTSDDPATALAPHTSNDAVSDYAYIYTYGTLSQALTFKADTAYTLTVDVAQGQNFSASLPFFVIDDGDTTTSVPAYFTSNLVSDQSTFTINTITFTTVGGGAGYIEFGNDPHGAPSDRGGYDGANVADFTNIALSGVSLGSTVPEPSAWALMFLGLGSLYFLVCRRGVSQKS